MDKDKLIEVAKGLLKHVAENPNDLKKFEPAPTEQSKAEIKHAAPAPAPKKQKKAFEPFFLSKARAKEIGEMLSKAKDCSGKYPQNGKMVKEEKKISRDPNGGMQKDEMPAKKPRSEAQMDAMEQDRLPAKKKPAAPAAPEADHVSVPRHLLQALHDYHAQDEMQHYADNGQPKNHVGRHWSAVSKLLGSK